jgi:hypothetical protein
MSGLSPRREIALKQPGKKAMVCYDPAVSGAVITRLLPRVEIACWKSAVHRAVWLIRLIGLGSNFVLRVGAF